MNNDGWVNGVNKKHQAIKPIINKHRSPALFNGSLYATTSERSGNPMWLQKECAANGATKCPKEYINTNINSQQSYNKEETQ